MPGFGGVHHLNFTVTDLARSTDWYMRVLGLTHGWDMDDPEGKWRKVILLHPHDPLRLVLTEHRANDGGPFDESRTGMDHAAFAVSDRASLEEWLRHFDASNVDHSPIKEGATGWVITFRDPDNIQLEMYTVTK